MVYDRERERRDDAVYAEHKAAIAAGEKRVLRRTRTGELHSYPADEIGFSPGRGQAQIRTWWGMAILSAIGWLMFAGAVLMFVMPAWNGEGFFWGAVWLMAMAGFLAHYGFRLSRDEYRAAKLRKERGSPTPGTGSVDVDLLELGEGKR